MASLVAPGETSQAAIDVFDKGVAARGVPQRPRGRQRRGPGPQPAPSHRPPGRGTCAPRASNPPPADPTGPPPTGDNERFHQTLLRHPGRQPLADSIAEPPGDGSTASTTSTTPSAPTRACPGASPRSRPGTPPRWPRHPDRTATPLPSPPAANPRATRPPGADRRTGAGPSPPAASAKPAITRNGTVHIGGIAFLVRRALAGHRTTAIWDATTITFTDVHGEVLIQYNWPPEGVTYASHHPPDPTNQRARPRPQEAPTVTEVLTHRTSPMS